MVYFLSGQMLFFYYIHKYYKNVNDTVSCILFSVIPKKFDMQRSNCDTIKENESHVGNIQCKTKEFVTFCLAYN